MTDRAPHRLRRGGRPMTRRAGSWRFDACGGGVTGQQRELVLLALLLAAAPVMTQALDLLAKRLDVLKAAVHGGEAHVGDLIQMSQLLHDQLADAARGHLALAEGAQPMTDARGRLLDGIQAHGALFQRLEHAALELALIEGLAAAVALDDPWHEQLRGLESREALTAAQALTPSSHLPALGGQTRIGHLGVIVTAEGTAHPRAPCEVSPRTRGSAGTAR